MNSDHTLHSPPPSVPSAKLPISSRASPRPPATIGSRDIMSLPTFQSMRPALTSHSPFGHSSRGSTLFDVENLKPIAPIFPSVTKPCLIVRIRFLPLNTTEESLKLLLFFSEELVDLELLAPELTGDRAFRSALLRIKTLAGGIEVKNKLHGRPNFANDAMMEVEFLNTTPSGGISAEPLSSFVHGASAPGSRPQRLHSAFSPIDQVSSPQNGMFTTSHELPNPETNNHYHAIFSPQSPIGNHLTDRAAPGITGKSLINGDYGDDDETTDLLKDPVAYAKSGATAPRRSTGPQLPQLPIGQMQALSLSTNNPSGSSTLSSYANPMSPATASGQGTPYQANAPHYGRANFPPVNPADQNPPCNTLYVGNLPMDTSEEELKAMFSKQRGYKRLCFRAKANGPMCFVEFEDISFATKALHDLYGAPLHNSVKGGIRLSFSKNPLGVRSGQNPAQAPQPGMNINGMTPGLANGFTSASGPPPGLAIPPGLGTGRTSYNVSSGSTIVHPHSALPINPNNPWNPPFYSSPMSAGPNSVLGGTSSPMPRHMMGR